jgi:mxaD protein
MNSLLNTLLLTAFFSFSAFADHHAALAPALTVEEKITINTPADKVWNTVKNFNDLGAWHPAVATTELIGGKNNVRGTMRVLTLQDGGKITETLLTFNEREKTYSYAINEGALPVNQYYSTITVSAVDANSTEVVWQSSFKRKDLSHTPVKGQDDESAFNVITAVYQGGLNNLKTISE